MPPRGYRLQHEALACKPLRILSLAQFPRREPIPVRWPSVLITFRVDIGLGIWLFEELWREQAAFGVGKLDIRIPRHEHVDPIPQIPHKAHFIDEFRRRRYQRQTRYSLRNQKREFLRDHAAHAGA